MLDSHCHLDRYDDPKKVAAEAHADGVFIIAVTNLPSHFEIGKPHVKSMTRVRLALGLHPLAADQHEKERAQFEHLFPSTSFIGEVGLDFSREGKATAEIQLKSFRLVAKLLSNNAKFVTVHSRGAEQATLEILGEFNHPPVVFHWYTGPVDLIDEAIAAGHYFSVNPAMVASEKGRKTISELPRNRVLTETDGPFVKLGGKPVMPQAVARVEEYLSESWSIDTIDVRNAVWSNFRQLLTGVGLLKSL